MRKGDMETKADINGLLPWSTCVKELRYKLLLESGASHSGPESPKPGQNST